MREQPALDIHPLSPSLTTKAAKAMGSDDPVTGNHERQAIGAKRTRQRSRPGPQLLRQLSIGHNRSRGNGLKRCMNAALKGCASTRSDGRRWRGGRLEVSQDPGDPLTKARIGFLEGYRALLLRTRLKHNRFKEAMACFEINAAKWRVNAHTSPLAFKFHRPLRHL